MADVCHDGIIRQSARELPGLSSPCRLTLATAISEFEMGDTATRMGRAVGKASGRPSDGPEELLPSSAKRRDLTLAVAAVFLLVWGVLTRSRVGSWNDASRLATAEALVEQGTWAIENTRLGRLTADQLLWEGSFYSDKPPVLSFMAAGVYGALRAAAGVDLSDAYCQPLLDTHWCLALLEPEQADWAYYSITLVLVGLPSALLLSLFYRATAFFGLRNSWSIALTLALGLGTTVFPFSLVFSNHVPAAAGLMVGLYALQRARQGTGDAQRWLALAGFGTALAVTFDLLAAPILVAFLALSLYRHRRRGWAFLAAAAVPLFLLAALDVWALGDPLPPSLHASGFDYPGSAFAPTITGNPPSIDAARHALLMLFGERGLFTLNPVMMLSLAGLFLLLRRRDHLLRDEALAVLAGSSAVVVALAFFTPGYGGTSYGTRWLAEITPILLLFAADPVLYRCLGCRLLFLLLGGLSVVSAWQGAVCPWGTSLPPARLLQYTVSPVGRYLEALPADAIAYATPGQARYLPEHPAHAWRTSLRPFEAGSGLVPAGDPGRVAVFLVDGEDAGARGLLESVLSGGSWSTVEPGFSIYQLGPSSERVSPRVQAEARFAGLILLVGSDPPSLVPRPGETLSLRLYWQALELTYQPYTAFVHLTGETNPRTGSLLWAQDDHEPGRGVYATNSWFPGEIVVDSFQLVVPEDAPAGEYLVSTGFYNRITLERLARTDGDGDTAMLFSITVLSN
jgi:hypothetical protein